MPAFVEAWMSGGGKRCNECDVVHGLSVRMVLRKKGRWILERPCKSGDFYLRLSGQEDSHAHISNNYNKPIGPLLTCCGELCGCR
jgi:hypothetical protein